MKQSLHHIATAFACLLAALVITGCASTKVSNHEQLVTEQMPRPAHIWVYNFVASPAELPADSALTSQAAVASTNQTPELAELGRQLGHEMARQLAIEIQNIGMPGELATDTTKPAVHDIVIRGYLVSIEEGSKAKRMTVGFGSGGSQLTTMVEGYQMTSQGLRKLGQGTLGAAGSKGPGAALGGAAWIITGNPVGLIVGGGLKVYGEASGSAKIEGRAKQTAKELGEIIKTRCQEQGWIN